MLTFIVMLMALGASGQASGWVSSSRNSLCRLAEAFLSGAGLLPAEKGAGTAPALTDALLHAGMNLLVLALSLKESSHFSCRGWCLWLGFSPSPPSPGWAGALQGPLPVRPEGLSAGASRNSWCTVLEHVRWEPKVHLVRELVLPQLVML